jgi:A/G-specific adenine glycosylase
LRLHATATVLTRDHNGQVPASLAALRGLPGVGSYTAAAVASFAFGQRHAVLDTNVRRVLARLVRGEELPPRSTSAAEVRLAEALLPAAPGHAARWSVAVMELGALVCTATRPDCAGCPVARRCAWRRAGSPAGPPRPGAQPRYQGSDRECRGRLLSVLREAAGPVPAARLDAAWPGPEQRARALAGLVADGLAAELEHQMYALPSHTDAAH